MDQIKIGKFIYNLRKKNNLTQSEFANKLNVTSQAVSKWENGRGIPDIEILKHISEEFNVDIKEILEGEEKRQKKNHMFLVLIVCIIVILLSLFLLFKNNNEYKFSPIITNNPDFALTGAVAYSNDKKSIYISNITYKNDSENESNYYSMECVLYEENNNTEEKISQFGDINQYDKNKLYKLSELLQNVSFNVENYSSSCKDLATHKLYIIISVLDNNYKTVIYKIPLSLTDSCK
jgi:transcriptional regulator with XRE-family HTH domain